MNRLEDIKTALNKATCVALFTHINPDGDALGSSFAMKAILESLGKKVTLFLEKPIPSKYDFLDKGYALTGQGSDFDAALALDCGSVNRLGELRPLYESVPLKLVLDHHYADAPFGDIYLTVPESAACAELVFQLGEMMCQKLPPEALMPLYTGISTDTGHFKFSNVTKETHRIAANLIEAGVDHRQITRRLYETVSLSKLKFTGAMAEQVRMFYDARVAVLTCFDSFLESFGLTHEDVEELPNTVLTIQGVKVSVIIKNREQGGFKVSLRCKENIDLAELSAAFGGGGHKCAAGFVTQLSYDDLEEKLVGMIVKRLEAMNE